MLVKITILVLVVTFIYKRIIENYVSNTPLEVIKIRHTDYCPMYLVICGLLRIASGILIIASIVYLLFFRG